LYSGQTWKWQSDVWIAVQFVRYALWCQSQSDDYGGGEDDYDDDNDK